MIPIKKEESCHIAALFEAWQETLIWSFLDGCMGTAWTDCLQQPKVAQINIGDFCFIAGEARSEEARRLINDMSQERTYSGLLVIPQNKAWEQQIETTYKGNYEKIKRYAFKKEKGIFDKKNLEGLVNNLPTTFTLAPIDEVLYHELGQEEWSKDFCSQFKTYEAYRAHGLGYVVLHQGRPVCSASSYTFYSEGIEIEVGTKDAYRRQGLATACSVKLILSCLEKGLYPSWDAANLASVGLATKLGYQRAYDYTTYICI